MCVQTNRVVLSASALEVLEVEPSDGAVGAHLTGEELSCQSLKTFFFFYNEIYLNLTFIKIASALSPAPSIPLGL